MSDSADNRPPVVRPLSGSPILPFVGVTTLIVLILLPSLSYPFGPDDSAYAYVARRLLKGDVLYRDVWESKLGIYFLYAGVFHFFGDTTYSLRAFDIAWQMMTAGFVYLIAADTYERRAACVAATLYALFYMDTNFWSMAQADSFLNLPSLIAVYSWMQCVRRRELSWAVWAGFGVGVAALLRPTAAVMILTVPFICKSLRVENSPNAMKVAVVSLLAGAITFIPFAMYFTVFHAWNDFAITWFRLNPFYAAQIGFSSWGEALVSIARQLQNTQWLDTRLELALILFGPAYALTQLKTKRYIWIPFGYLLVAFLGLAIQRKFFVYQWSPLFPPLAMLGGGLLEMDRLVESIPAERRRRIAVPGIAVMLFLIASCLFVQGRNYAEAVSSRIARRPAMEAARYFVGEGFSHSIELRVARYVRDHSSRDDTICVWGFSPALHFLSRRDAAAGRLFLSHVILWPATPKSWKDEYFRRLYSRPPKFFIIRCNDVMPQLTGRNDDSRAQVNSIPELRKFVSEHYRLVETIGQRDTPELYDVHRRVDAQQ